MNVFACHPDPTIAASWLADQHVVKMVTETAQILSTALQNGHLVAGLYAPTHIYHPCVQAARADAAYFGWTARHGLALAAEYTTRFGRKHVAEAVVQLALDSAPFDPALLTTQPKMWPMAMPDICKRPNPHAAYCEYLRVKYADWRERGGVVAPRWKRVAPDNPFVQ